MNDDVELHKAKMNTGLIALGMIICGVVTCVGLVTEFLSR